MKTIEGIENAKLVITCAAEEEAQVRDELDRYGEVYVQMNNTAQVMHKPEKVRLCVVVDGYGQHPLACGVAIVLAEGAHALLVSPLRGRRVQVEARNMSSVVE